MTTNKVRDTFDTVRECITFNVWDVLADDVNEDGEPVVTNGDALDDLIDLYEILARMESRRIADIKRDNESIL